jgi:hypothetical protein
MTHVRPVEGSTGGERYPGGKTVITFEDCLALCELTEAEIDAIAEHEQLPETVALELGSCLVHAPDGELRIQQIIIDDIGAAQQRGDLAHAARLKQTLRRFIEQHPQCRGAAGGRLDADQ